MESELYKPFKLCFWIFKIFGMLQNGEQTWAYFIIGYIVHFFSVEYFVIGSLIYTFNAKDFCLCCCFIAQTFKSLIFFYRMKRIKKLLESLESLLKFSANPKFPDRVQLNKDVKFAYKVFKAFLFTGLITVTFGTISVVVTRKLPQKVWFPFDTVNSQIGFLIAIIYLQLDPFYVSSTDIALDVLPVIFMSFAIGLMNELAERIKRIGSETDDNIVDEPGTSIADARKTKAVARKILSDQKSKEELIKCIEIHWKLKEFIDDIQANFALSILSQGLMISIILCLFVSAFLKKKPLYMSLCRPSVRPSVVRLLINF
jgi:hypothetical protein